MSAADTESTKRKNRSANIYESAPGDGAAMDGDCQNLQRTIFRAVTEMAMRVDES
jgi:hypothetical protein